MLRISGRCLILLLLFMGFVSACSLQKLEDNDIVTDKQGLGQGSGCCGKTYKDYFDPLVSKTRQDYLDSL